MSYQIKQIAEIINAGGVVFHDSLVKDLLLDSRKINSAEHSLFFAIRGERRDGHQFIQELYERGVRSFVISQPVNKNQYRDASFLEVKDTLAALQQLAAFHRKQFNIPVIGITGSNGKTIVKEWLYLLLQEEYSIVRSPKSYNSQIGVPLSIWQMDSSHDLGIFEAGISRKGEMERLAAIIQPTIGILTNIGEAHSEGFSSIEEKESEKRVLLEKTRVPERLTIISVEKQAGSSVIQAGQKGQSLSIEIPFTDEASVKNAITCWELMLMLGYEQTLISDRMKKLMPVNMRLELKKGINHCTIINDSYSADLSSFEIALNFLEQQSPNEKKTLIISDFLQSSLKEELLYKQVLETIKRHRIQRIIGIGEKITSNFQHLLINASPGLEIKLYYNTDDFITHFRSGDFRDETILIKGARVFLFEKIVQMMEQKAHQTVLEINLNAIANNLREYKRILRPSVKIMAMVKAFAYGSGGAEIAGILQYHKVDYLGVAYADEGIELRKAGIRLPIMVMNPDENDFELIIENNLEPEIYSFELLYAFEKFLHREAIQVYPIHIEIETGMNRLGFSTGDVNKLCADIKSSSSFKIQSVFTHLAASEDPAQDEFTLKQASLFHDAAEVLQKESGYPFLKHIANSAAIIRYPQLQLDMVRLGIGLYGVDSAASGKLNLQPVATLKSTIAQIKKLKKGESVSYNRKGIIGNDSLVATVRIGYADGYPRRLGNGVGKVWLHGKFAPVIGTVCMDMFMIDITNIPGVKEGDEVIIFGKELPVEEMARQAETIPYEIMTGVSQRVKRVYFEE